MRPFMSVCIRSPWLCLPVCLSLSSLSLSLSLSLSSVSLSPLSLWVYAVRNRPPSMVSPFPGMGGVNPVELKMKLKPAGASVIKSQFWGASFLHCIYTSLQINASL